MSLPVCIQYSHQNIENGRIQCVFTCMNKYYYGKYAFILRSWHKIELCWYRFQSTSSSHSPCEYERSIYFLLDIVQRCQRFDLAIARAIFIRVLVRVHVLMCEHDFPEHVYPSTTTSTTLNAIRFMACRLFARLIPIRFQLTLFFPQHLCRDTHVKSVFFHDFSSLLRAPFASASLWGEARNTTNFISKHRK